MVKSKSHNVFTNHYFGCFSWWALSFGQLCKGMWVLILLVIVIYLCLTYMVKNRVEWCSGLIITLWFQFQWLKKCLFSLFFLCFSPFIKSPELMGSTMRNRPPRSQFMKTYTAGGLKIKSCLQCRKSFKTKHARGKTEPDICTQLNITLTLVFSRKLLVPLWRYQTEGIKYNEAHV